MDSSLRGNNLRLPSSTLLRAYFGDVQRSLVPSDNKYIQKYIHMFLLLSVCTWMPENNVRCHSSDTIHLKKFKARSLNDLEIIGLVRLTTWYALGLFLSLPTYITSMHQHAQLSTCTEVKTYTHISKQCTLQCEYFVTTKTHVET